MDYLSVEIGSIRIDGKVISVSDQGCGCCSDYSELTKNEAIEKIDIQIKELIEMKKSIEVLSEPW